MFVVLQVNRRDSSDGREGTCEKNFKRSPAEILVRESFSLIDKTIVAMNPEQGLSYHSETDLSYIFRANFLNFPLK